MTFRGFFVLSLSVLIALNSSGADGIALMRNCIGIDVCESNGNINWTQVAQADIEFAMIRTTVGTVKDSKFVDNTKSAKANNVSYVGAFHVFRMSSSPVEQMLAIAEQLVAANHSTSFFAISIEEDPHDHRLRGLLTTVQKNENADKLYQLLQLFENLGNFKYVTIKTSPSTWTSLVSGDWKPFENYRLWLVKNQDDQPEAIAPWSGVYMWQTATNGTVRGITGNVHMNKATWWCKHMITFSRMSQQIGAFVESVWLRLKSVDDFKLAAMKVRLVLLRTIGL